MSTTEAGNWSVCWNNDTGELIVDDDDACTSSSIRYKHDITGLDIPGLEILNALKPKSFVFNGDSKNEVLWGFIAEDTYEIDRQFGSKLTDINEDELPNGFYEKAILVVLTDALQELDQRTHFIESAYGTSTLSQLTIDDVGNIGIGFATTSVLTHKLDVNGEIGAYGFVNISTSGAKRDIEFLSDGKEREILAKIVSTSVASYMGLIAEEAPLEILSVDGQGVDLYKMSSFMWAGMKAMALKQDEQEKRIADGEMVKFKGTCGDPVSSVSDGATGQEFSEPYQEPISGCMDNTAINFNAGASEDDGSCVYQSPEPEEPVEPPVSEVELPSLPVEPSAEAQSEENR